MKLYVDNRKKERDIDVFPDIQEAIRYACSHMAEEVEIELEEGIYRLMTPVLIESGMGLKRVKISGRNREKTILCGSIEIHAEWERYKDNIYRARLKEEADPDMLYINGRLYHMARYPKYDEKIQICQGYAADCISEERTKRWKNPKGGYLHALHKNLWGDFHYRICGKDEKGSLILKGGTQNNRRMGIHETYRYVENIFEELSAPGEWFYNKADGFLYVIFRPEDNPENARVEVVVNEELLRVIGTPDILQTDVSLQNLTFRHTRRTFMKTAEPLLRSDWCIYRGGALYFENTQNCRLENCDIFELGSNGVCVNGKNRGFEMNGCLLHDIGGNGICFVGKTECVRNPLFEYGERMTVQELDWTKGAKCDHYPLDCQVSDCLIYRTGRVEKQTAAIQISVSGRIHISHCSVYEVPRAAVNFSDGCFGGHIMEDCDIFDTVLETGDHGSFNSWGRDRYWGLEGVDLNRLKEASDPKIRELPFLDAVDTNIIRHNRIRCDRGWDIDLDDGSGNYEICNNLCLNGGIKLREGFGRTVYNNITVNNTVHVHVWYRNSGDSIVKNVVFRKYEDIRMPEDWGDRIDFNIMHAESMQPGEVMPARLLQSVSGKDEHSVLCNCMFRNPTEGDYTVQNEGAFRTGFQNFAMEDFGVLSERLKNQARQPEFPRVRILQRKKEEEYFRHGQAVFKNIVSIEEASAYGAAFRETNAMGVIVCILPENDVLFSRGLRSGDIILGINGSPVGGTADLKRMAGLLDRPWNVEFQILRDQREMKL